MTNKTIVLADGTGNLGGRIIKELLKKDIEVQVLVRTSSNKEKIAEQERKSVISFQIIYNVINKNILDRLKLLV